MLKKHAAELRYLFIVSDVQLTPGGSNGAGLDIKINKAPGQKCDRCWNYSTEVGKDAEYPTVCERCAPVLHELEATAGHDSRRRIFLVPIVRYNSCHSISPSPRRSFCLIAGRSGWSHKRSPSSTASRSFPGFFKITHLRNKGAAFSLFANAPDAWRTATLVIFSLVALVVVLVLLVKCSHRLSLQGVALSLILGGAVGNLWDRIVHGWVTDFLLVYYKQWEWPAFNVADSAICVGAVC